MNVKLLTVSVIAAFSIPVEADINKNDLGLDACAEAMVAQLTETNENKMNYKLTDDSQGFEGRLKGTEVIYLDAKDKNEEVIARYNCFINEDAKVEKLVAVSVDAPDAKYRARKFY
jgi:hypothetical protein